MYVQTKPCFIEGAAEKPATLKNFEKDIPFKIHKERLHRKTKLLFLFDNLFTCTLS